MPQVQPASTILPLCRYPVMLQWWFIGTALACILHGAVLIVSFVCVYWLSRNGQRLSPVHRRILYFYVAFMTLLACGGVIWSIFSLFRVLFNAKGVRGSPLGPAGSVIHVFANWGADGFLVRSSESEKDDRITVRTALPMLRLVQSLNTSEIMAHEGLTLDLGRSQHRCEVQFPVYSVPDRPLKWLVPYFYPAQFHEPRA